MCGIVGYIGPREASDVVLAGLRRLEYRGYDSGGIAVLSAGSGQIASRKRAGKLDILAQDLLQEPLPVAHVGIGHTRWATHGAPNELNAHPHLSADGSVAVIHNGIIENHAELRAELLAAGVEFQSETDTEVSAHLLAQLHRSCSLAQAMRQVAAQLRGAFTLVAVSTREPNVLVAVRRNSPLVVGRGQGENFVGSDVAAFIDATRTAIALGEDEVVELTCDEIRVTDLAGAPVQPEEFEVTWDAQAAEKEGYELYMLKEIAEQPKAIADTLLGRIQPDGQVRLDEMSLSPAQLQAVSKIFIVACGTAYHAGMVAKYAIEHWAGVPCEVELASEFRYRDPILDPSMLVIVISQSGETMDTLMALRHAKAQRAQTLAICNTIGASIPREADAVLYTHAGPEVSVASTKAFLTQVVAVYLVGLGLAQVRGTKFADEIAHVAQELAAMPQRVDLVLDTMDGMKEIALEIADASTVLFIGRHVGYPVALEGALKLKELAYMHAEGFAAGELKHGPIALIEPGTPVIAVVPPRSGNPVIYEKIMSNIAEVRARGARTIVLAEEGDVDVAHSADFLIQLPACPTLLQPLVATVPLQYFACDMAMLKGFDVDKPRNLAKSVTVE